jgi:hypothetical protein
MCFLTGVHLWQYLCSNVALLSAVRCAVIAREPVKNLSIKLLDYGGNIWKFDNLRVSIFHGSKRLSEAVLEWVASLDGVKTASVQRL